MEKLTKKIEELDVLILARINELIEIKGIPSEHVNKSVLKVSDEHAYNIEGGRWLTEIFADGLIDNCGYTYSLDEISKEELCLALDDILEQQVNFRVGTFDSDGKEKFVYFDDEEVAYNNFVDNRTTEEEVWMDKRVKSRHGEFEFETLHSYCADEDED